MRLYYIIIGCFLSTALQAQLQPTWSAGVDCLIYTNCTTCHNDNGIAPFSLESYEDAFQNRFRMLDAILNRKMPPWPPNPHYSRLAKERMLSDEEVELFRLWVEQGGPEGNGSDALEAPVIESNIQIQNPDFSYTLPEYTVPDLRETDLYRCYLIPTDEESDRFITGVEVIPGNRSIVHHVLVFADTTGIPRQLDAEDTGPGYTCFGGIGTNDFAMISGWVPGSDANFSPPGMGIFLPKGADIVVQLHYPEGSAGEVDATTINFTYADDNNLRPLLNIPALNHSTSLDEEIYVPANTRKTYHGSQISPFDLTVTGIAPHAHLICESMKAFAVTPIGDTIALIDVPHWDFEWQGFYDFQVAKKIPFGSILYGEATYNNTTSNPHLPHDVPVDVHLGEATTDEMFIFFLSVTFYQPGDENLIIDTSAWPLPYQGCNAFDNQITPVTDHTLPDLFVAPNPSRGNLLIDISNVRAVGAVQMSLHNAYGQLIYEAILPESRSEITLPTYIANGTYSLKISDLSQKLLHSPRKVILLR